MRQAKVMRALEPHQLLPHAVLALAQRGDPTPSRRHPLTDVQVEPFDKGGIDLPATGSQRGLGTGPVAWRRGDWTQCPKWVSRAVMYALNPSVRNNGTQPGARTCT